MKAQEDIPGWKASIKAMQTALGAIALQISEISDRDMLEAAIEALVTGGENCPFTIAGPLNDGLHVDITDPECYARCADFGPEWAVQCRICVREALEERAIALKESRA